MFFSEKVLKEGYTIFISKQGETIRGSYLQSFEDGIFASDLPPQELHPLNYLKSITQSLDEGALLQITQYGPQITGIIGNKKTEGPYCETEYLEVIGQKSDFDYFDTLIKLDAELSIQKVSNKNVNQYTKLYKGVDRYE